MATTSSSFRSSNKANSEWLHDDDLFEQFIATGSLNLCDSNTADAEALDNTLVDLGNSNSEDSRVPPGEKDEEEEEEEDDTGGVDISGELCADSPLVSSDGTLLYSAHSSYLHIHMIAIIAYSRSFGPSSVLYAVVECERSLGSPAFY